MLNDPTLAPIEQKKQFSLWPPSKDNIADSLYPYLKRMKQENLKILLIGDKLAENAFRFLEIDDAKKIKRIEIVNSDQSHSQIMEANIKYANNHRIVIAETGEGKLYDVVFIDSENKPLDETMKINYDCVTSHGIFCGNNHHKTYVKEALGKFRRETKIGTPIMISNRLCWFWIKR